MKKDKVIALILVVCVLSVLFYISRRRNSSLAKNLAYSHGIVKKIDFHYKDPGIRFTFIFLCSNGESLENISFLNCRLSKIEILRTLFANKEMPLIIDSTNCDDSFLLLSSKLVKQFRVEKMLSRSDLILIESIDSVCCNY